MELELEVLLLSGRVGERESGRAGEWGGMFHSHGYSRNLKWVRGYVKSLC